MTRSLDDILVIGVASSALFDLEESDRIFREKGLDEYREYQRKHENDVLAPGAAFPLVQRLLRLDETICKADGPGVEVILLSRNDPDTGMRVMNSIEAHKLRITRAIFVGGRDPTRFMGRLNGALFLSANTQDVARAIANGYPAGRVFPTDFADKEDDMELRIAFDFDGVLADDSSEKIFRREGEKAYLKSEVDHAGEALNPGPLAKFFVEIARLQQVERLRRISDPKYNPCLRTAIVTARSAPAHKRVVTTLRTWGIEVDEVFFLGGIEKKRILEEFKPHIFFDDQLKHIQEVCAAAPSAHVPFGIANIPSLESIQKAYEEYDRKKNSEKPGNSHDAL